MFEEWYLSDLVNEKIRNIWKLTDYYLLRLIYDILEKTGVDTLLAKGSSVSGIIESKGFPAKVNSALTWMLDRLYLDKYIDRSGDSDPVYKFTGKTMEYNLEEIRNEAASKAPTSISALNMLQLVADSYPEYLNGTKLGVDIIFNPDAIDITNSYYTKNLFYNVHNIAGAKIINWDISQRENPKIIEFGVGLGGGTRQFVQQRVNENLPMTGFSYTYTDIANKMLRTTKKSIRELTEDISSFSSQKLDFNRDLTEQGIEDNSVDVLWGVNAIHVAVDMRKTMEYLYKALKPGGALIVSETVRPVGNSMIQQEFILNTLDDYWDVKLDPEIRPQHGFMDWTHWVNAFKAIGFSSVESIPDMSILQQQYDNCYVAVTRGVK
jgi:SAM-dependent methyltransferase